MLSELTISNFAIIDHIEISFNDGLTVLTGETGAGKSIISDAIDFLLGSRGNNDLIKTGSQKAFVEGTFLFPENLNNWFKKNEFDVETCRSTSLLTISRELTSQGSKARINGSLANVSHLSVIREHLIEIHEQSEHIELLKIEKQLDILDNSGDSEHKKLLENYKNAFHEYQDIKNKLESYLTDAEQIAKQIDYLKFQINEIKSAEIKDPNEENELLKRHEILLNKKGLIENASTIYGLINGVETHGHGFLQETLSEIKKLIKKSSEHDKSFEPYIETIENITDEIKDLSSFASSYCENLPDDSKELEKTEERLDLFYNLKRKYGKNLGEIQEYLKQIQNELKEVETIHELSLLEDTFKQKEKEINELANKLTKSREKITRIFVDKVNEELKTLGFKGVGAFHETPLLVIEFLDCALCSNGKEQIQFLFSANPDEPPKPLLKVASGGELSRIMLAIKSIDVGAGLKPAPTMVFDEIDIGVSGEIAASVAKKLYKISRNNQIICITHQPIIASMADCHFVIEKKVEEGITKVNLREIKENEKADAIALLLTPENKREGGITEDARVFAKSLLENARRIKEKEIVML